MIVVFMVDLSKLMSSLLLLVILIESKRYRFFIYNLLIVISCRHTDDMIKKLESAGLGFYVKATETQQKLGINLYIVIIANLKCVIN